MKQKNIIISPKTRVGELLDAYPSLEAVLMEMSPAFEKLKNPVLRKTVARVASLQQVAVIGGLKIQEVINRLRKEAGQEGAGFEIENQDYLPGIIPDWLDKSRITGRYDATPVINNGESPMQEILRKTSVLSEGEILELQSPFIPAPIIDMLREKGFRTFSTSFGNHILTWISR